MIRVTPNDSLSFTVQFDPSMADILCEASGWGSTATVLETILSNALFGQSIPPRPPSECDDDIPF